MKKEEISVVILAAGKGSRMKSPMAKVLHNISGKEMLYHITKASFEISDDVTIVVAHQKDEVIKKISKYFDGVTFVTQDDVNFPGTGGALKNITPKHDKVLILNGDMPLITKESLMPFLDSDAQIIMSVLKLQNPDGYGRVVIENSNVMKIVEQKDASASELAIDTVNAGVYAFSKSVIRKYIPLLNNNNAQREYYLTDIISMAREDGVDIFALIVDEEEFKGVNSKKDLSHAEEIMQERIKTKAMEAGVIMQLPDTIYIEEGVVFEGECKVENGCRITGNSKIIRSHIKAHSVVEDSIVEDSDVGPMAHLRPLSNIKDTHIGNFVELKKSTLKGVKAGHLSYIGDATIGEGTNIGAGVITCNYDGKKKYETIIGKNVFIGSDSQLIAPVEIEDDVMIGAGTTLRSGKVASGNLAVSSSKLKLIENFYYKFFGK